MYVAVMVTFHFSAHNCFPASMYLIYESSIAREFMTLKSLTYIAKSISRASRKAPVRDDAGTERLSARHMQSGAFAPPGCPKAVKYCNHTNCSNG